MRSQLFGQRFFVGAFGDGHGFKSHFPGELNAQMSQASDPLDRDEISGPGSAVSKRVVGGDSGAKNRRRFFKRNLIWNSGQGFFGGDHIFGIAPVVNEPRDL